MANLQGWQRDPFGQHEQRYFSQGQPTRLVRDGAVESYHDLPTSHPPSPGNYQPAPGPPREAPIHQSEPEDVNRRAGAGMLAEGSAPVASGADPTRRWWSSRAGFIFGAASVVVVVLATVLLLASAHQPALKSTKHKPSSPISLTPSSGGLAPISSAPTSTTIPSNPGTGGGTPSNGGQGTPAGGSNTPSFSALSPATGASGSPVAQAPETPLAILLPIGAGLVLLAGFGIRQRREGRLANSSKGGRQELG